MVRRRAFLFLAGVVGLMLVARATSACICSLGNEGNTVREIAVSHSSGSNSGKIVFEGLVEKQEIKTGFEGSPAGTLSMTMRGQYRSVSVRVLRAYRGQASGDVIVLTGVGLGDCGLDFDTEEKYLIYADRNESGDLYTSICSGTAPIDQSGPDLRYLRGEKPTTEDLLSWEAYSYKVEAKWYGTACGRVTKSDGTPLGEASVAVMQVRGEPLPPRVATDSNLSKKDGRFCVDSIVPGKYILTAEKIDYDKGSRWMGFYPGVGTHLAAAVTEVRAGEHLSGLHFTAREENLYTVRIRVVTSDGSPVPLNNLGVAIDSPDQDSLAYHLMRYDGETGVSLAGYVPPGHYTVQTYIQPDFEARKIPAELSIWGMAKQEVDIPSGSEITLMLNPAR
jgi:hypothetical protein